MSVDPTQPDLDSKDDVLLRVMSAVKDLSYTPTGPPTETLTHAMRSRTDGLGAWSCVGRIGSVTGPSDVNENAASARPLLDPVLRQSHRSREMCCRRLDAPLTAALESGLASASIPSVVVGGVS